MADALTIVDGSILRAVERVAGSIEFCDCTETYYAIRRSLLLGQGWGALGFRGSMARESHGCGWRVHSSGRPKLGTQLYVYRQGSKCAMSQPSGTARVRPGFRSVEVWSLSYVTRTICLLFALLLWSSMPASAQRRAVWGLVTDSTGEPVAGVAVKLSNRVTLQIRSSMTQADGKYRFSGLHPDMDYTVRAQKDGHRTKRRWLSHFNTRKLVRLRPGMRSHSLRNHRSPSVEYAAWAIAASISFLPSRR